jgi:hypothetical protein
MIVELRAENFQRLKAVQIRPHGRVVRLTGDNGEGKTSVLEAIASAIRGKDACPRDPIRGGADKAWISLDLGDKIVRRTFSRGKDGKPFTTSLTVEAKVEGGTAKLTSPQAVIDSMMGDISFDPLVFLSMDAKAQVNALHRFVPGVDFAAIAQANEQDKQARTETNRKAKDAATRAKAIAVPADLPASKIDEQALLDQITGAAQGNAEIETRRARRAEFAANVERMREHVARRRERIQELHREIETITLEVDAHDKRINEDATHILDAPRLPDPVDISAVSTALTDARRINSLIDQRNTRDALLREAAQHEFASESYTDAIEAREKKKRDAITAADLPVAGLGFTDDGLTWDGHPFEQASMAAKLRVGVALAMGSNPRLRVLRIRDGSLLSEQSMAVIAEMAEANDFQVWVELVDTSGRVGFVLEDGTVRDAEAA